jgi:hypothetical protein
MGVGYGSVLSKSGTEVEWWIIWGGVPTMDHSPDLVGVGVATAWSTQVGGWAELSITDPFLSMRVFLELHGHWLEIHREALGMNNRLRKVSRQRV